jgi:hypothetical protein
VTVTITGETVAKSAENAPLNARSRKHEGWASTALASSVWDAAASRFAVALRVSA